MTKRKHAVVIVGGGPTGLMLAGELALAGVDVAIVERRPDQSLGGLRAGGLHARSIEILDQRGIADRFLAAGQIAQVAGFAGTTFDLAGFPTRHPYGLGLWQPEIERLLAEWVDELKVRVYRGHEVETFSQSDERVEVLVSDGQTLEAQFLVGCDGGRSLVRREAGIGFPGSAATVSHIIATVEMRQIPEFGVHQGAHGIHAFSRADYTIRDGKVHYADSGPIGVMVTERELGPASDPTVDELRQALIASCGTDYGVHDPTWLTRFTDAARQANRYRSGRILIAGDAAHVHPPDGGQGLNIGLQDAMNLGWKLAMVVKREAPETLLDSYHDERHPVAARVLRNTLASVAFRRPDDRSAAARDVVAELLGMEEPRTMFAAMLSGLDIQYDCGEGHPLLGRRMPDLDLVTVDGPTTVYTLLHEGQPVLLNRVHASQHDIVGWDDRIKLLDATFAGTLTLPVVGEVDTPATVLIRPDGHVAWVGDGAASGLTDALTSWFGPGGGAT